MSWGTAYLLLLIKCTAVVVASHWNLAFNIHGSDGHNFGYHQVAWEDKTDVGADRNAFFADYKNYDVTLQDANFIAIVRHKNGECEAARVWESVAFGRSLQSYLDRSKSSGLKATFKNYTYTYISPDMSEVENDPFFSADGGLVFNFRYHDNGVRIGNRGWPKTLTDDSFQGLGNTFSSNEEVWHDVGDKCRQRCRTQGKDRGMNNNPPESWLYAQYAVFISDDAETFPCLKHQKLKIVMKVPTPKPTPNPTTSTYGEFKKIDRNNDGFVNFFELAFHLADANSDNLLSFEEYEAALRNQEYKED